MCLLGTTDGTEWMNPAQPSFEKKNLIDVTDVKGKALRPEGRTRN